MTAILIILVAIVLLVIGYVVYGSWLRSEERRVGKECRL